MTSLLPFRRKRPPPVAARSIPEPSIWNTEESALTLDREAKQGWHLRQNLPVMMGIVVGVAFTALLALLASAVRLSSIGTQVYFCVLCTAVAVLLACSRTIKHRRAIAHAYASRAEEARLDDNPDSDEVLVETWIVQQGVVTGIDRGMLMIDSDALIFTGNRSSFCIGSQDLLRFRTREPRRPQQQVVGAALIFLATPNHPITLVVRPIRRRGRFVPDRELFESMIHSLLNLPPTQVQRQYAPLQLDPLLPSPYRYHPLPGILILTLFIAIAAALPFGPLEPTVLIAFIPLLLDFMIWLLGDPRRARKIGRLSPGPEKP